MPHRRLPRGVCKHNISEEIEQISNLEVLEPEPLCVENHSTHDTRHTTHRPTMATITPKESARPPTHPGAFQRHLHCKAGNGRGFNLLTLPPPPSINSVKLFFKKKKKLHPSPRRRREELPPCWQCRPVEWPPPACWPRVELIYG